jgi:hypothetical protein
MKASVISLQQFNPKSEKCTPYEFMSRQALESLDVPPAIMMMVSDRHFHPRPLRPDRIIAERDGSSNVSTNTAFGGGSSAPTGSPGRR